MDRRIDEARAIREYIRDIIDKLDEELSLEEIRRERETAIKKAQR